MLGILLLTLEDSVCLFEVFTKIPQRIFTLLQFVHWSGPERRVIKILFNSRYKYLLLTHVRPRPGIMCARQHSKSLFNTRSNKIF